MLSAGGGGVALAQQAPTPPAASAARSWNVDARIAAYYDSNVSRTNKAAANVRGLAREDYTISPSLNASIVQPLGQQVLFLDGSVGYDFHARNTELDRRRYSVSGGGVTQVGPCRPVLYGSYRAAQSDLAEIDLTTTSNVLTTKALGVAVQCGRGVGLGGGVSVQRSDSKNSADTLVEQDHTDEALSVSLVYSAPNLVDGSVFYSYSNTEYPNRILFGRPIGDGFFSESVGLRLQRRFGSRLNAGGSVAATRLKREFTPVGEKAKITSTSYQADLQYRAGTRLTLSVSGARNIRPSDRPGKLYDIAETLEGRATYHLGGRFVVSAGHVYSDISSNVDTAAIGLVVTNSRSNSTFGSFEISRFGNGNLTFDVRHERRETNLPTFDYTAVRAGVTASYSF
jgi:hypothetical protein